MIAKLLGHAQVKTTARYAHLARDKTQEPAKRGAKTSRLAYCKGSAILAVLQNPNS